jgi:hypothetical protein
MQLCLNRLEERHLSVDNKNRIICDCEPECTDEVYETTISLSRWPACQHVDMMTTHPLSNDGTYSNYSSVTQLFIDHAIIKQDDYIEKNMLELHVYAPIE